MNSDFEAFWAAYPKKVAKGDARKAWTQTAAIRPPMKYLLEAVEKHCQQEAWRKDGGKFIPHPATWLRAERWEDQIEVVLPGVVGGKAWHETAQGIEHKGKELGISPDDYEHFPAFKAAVMRAMLVA
jgi:hypothetical protein